MKRLWGVWLGKGKDGVRLMSMARNKKQNYKKDGPDGDGS